MKAFPQQSMELSITMITEEILFGCGKKKKTRAQSSFVFEGEGDCS